MNITIKVKVILSYLRENAFSFEKAHVDKVFFEGLHLHSNN